MIISSQRWIKQPFVSGIKEPIGSTASRCRPFGSMGRVARKLVATPKRPRPLVSWRRLAAPSPRGIRRLSKEALRQYLMNNRWTPQALTNRWYHASLHLARQQKLTLRTSTQIAHKHRTSVRKITEGTALQPLTAQRLETQ